MPNPADIQVILRKLDLELGNLAAAAGRLDFSAAPNAADIVNLLQEGLAAEAALLTAIGQLLAGKEHERVALMCKRHKASVERVLRSCACNKAQFDAKKRNAKLGGRAPLEQFIAAAVSHFPKARDLPKKLRRAHHGLLRIAYRNNGNSIPAALKWLRSPHQDIKDTSPINAYRARQKALLKVIKARDGRLNRDS